MSDSHLPCHAHAKLRPCRSSQGHGMVGAWHGHDMASVNQTRPHCVNQMGKKNSKHLAARHGRGIGKAWARYRKGMGAAGERHAMCESALTGITSAHHWSLFWTRRICSSFPHPTSFKYTSTLPSLPRSLFLLELPNKNFYISINSFVFAIILIISTSLILWLQ